MKTLSLVVLCAVTSFALPTAQEAHAQVYAGIGAVNSRVRLDLIKSVSDAVNKAIKANQFNTRISYKNVDYLITFNIVKALEHLGYTVTIDRAAHEMLVSW